MREPHENCGFRVGEFKRSKQHLENDEVLRCGKSRGGSRCCRGAPRCVRPVVRRRAGALRGSISGALSWRARRPRMLRRFLEYRRRLVLVGSARWRHAIRHFRTAVDSVPRFHRQGGDRYGIVARPLASKQEATRRNNAHARTRVVRTATSSVTGSPWAGTTRVGGCAASALLTEASQDARWLT